MSVGFEIGLLIGLWVGLGRCKGRLVTGVVGNDLFDV